MISVELNLPITYRLKQEQNTKVLKQSQKRYKET